MPRPMMELNWFVLCAVVFSSVTLARSGSNITSCNSVPGSSPTTCNQGPCVKIPCVMQCGLKSSYESCQQHCDQSICDTLNCAASGTCNQTCQRGQCKELTCNAPNCFQDCNSGRCDKMTCHRNAATCVQSALISDLLCEARSCDQSCSRGLCNATCTSTVKTCNQEGDAGRNNMTCAPGVETCTQTQTRGVAIMRCDADVCKQNCTGYQCDMICSSSVKECHQICANELASCRLSCKAANCKSDCPVTVGSLGCIPLISLEKNITSCNSVPGSSPTTCNQGPCVKFPCVMQCGLKSSYESCQQHCDQSICDTLNCAASGTCNQTCQRGQCKELTCNAPNCFQDCNSGRCDKMTCHRNAATCVQSALISDLLCEARSCDQSCSRGLCNATCTSTVQTCNQEGDAGRNNMTCAPGVETCTQTQTRGVAIMRCDADVCKQNCTGYQCDMICSSSVKECHQICANELASCRLSCKAANCKSDCPAKVGSLGCSALTLTSLQKNITSCNNIPGSSPTTCNQGPCVKRSCVMQCGLKSSYETCQQHCDRSQCDTLSCRASGTCNQTCQLGLCKEVICNAPNCFQDCYKGKCDKMTCSKNAIKCVQSTTGKDLLCEARLCDQSCIRGICSATCTSTVKSCLQQSNRGRMNMTCAPGVETCTQNSKIGGVVIMICGGDTCKQTCLAGSRCEMVCSSSVKECNQICATGASCRLTCEADDCKTDCPAKVGSVGCTLLKINEKNDAPTFHVSVIFVMFLQSFIFIIELL